MRDWINKPTLDSGHTALHFASFCDNLDSVKLLVDFGADVEILNGKGLSVLHLACQGD